MTDPTSPDLPSWLQDVDTTKALLSHPSLLNNRFASRCLDVVNRLCSPASSCSAGEPEGQQQPFTMMPDQVLAYPSFGNMFPEVDQEMSMDGFNFMEWLNGADLNGVNMTQ